MTVVVPSRHYSTNPNEALFFFGGMWSNFDRSTPLYLQPPVPPPYPTFETIPLRYLSGEHWLHCNKGRTWEEHEYVRKAQTPFEAKERGRSIDLDRDEVKAWDARRYEVMVVGLRAKAAQNPGVLRLLLASGERLIAEDSPTDDVWGIRDARGGLGGQNLLGKAWMQVRAELREGA